MKTLICPMCGFVCCKNEYVYCPKCEKINGSLIFLEEVKAI